MKPSYLRRLYLSCRLAWSPSTRLPFVAERFSDIWHEIKWVASESQDLIVAIVKCFLLPINFIVWFLCPIWWPFRSETQWELAEKMVKNLKEGKPRREGLAELAAKLREEKQ